MDLDDYQKNALTTAIFKAKIMEMLDSFGVDDEQGDAYDLLLTLLGHTYWIVGVIEEVIETITVVDEGKLNPDNLTKEFGDIMWYCAVGAVELDSKLSAAWKVGVAPPMGMFGSRLLTRLIKQLKPLAGGAKRAFRDDKGVLSDDKKQVYLMVIGSIMRTVLALADYYMLDFKVILSTNLEKLADRKERDALTGAGDER